MSYTVIHDCLFDYYIYHLNSTSQMNVVGALVTGRTAVGSYNNNQKAETIYPGDAKRVIKLKGYYN